ncbi:N-formylglutamate amidohydrolase [Qipengyuania soli]|uniref:N-formylglutamate amidohydrolase n=1 Tax=Qipengyuania soli TaxID=2782568 RepID=A0A7S8F6L8_9SPHN|nr:N-formylglutamate amidohydrolase [Qipengyuania soli]QPD00150.1 N-formylglutamate amidohydrolase [Qipengyuania soli]
MIDGRPYRQAGVGDLRTGGVICVADHASNHVPAGVELGIDRSLLNDHIAIDIGVEGVADRLARRHGLPAHIASVSRLVCDFNRDEEDPAAVPTTSDGHLIPGNIGADVEARLDRFHRPYHDALADFVAAARPRLIVALHSFTPALKTSDQERPWEVALLYNEDDRAARHAIRMLGQQGLNVGDNEPYSGKDLNATMNRHAEANGIPYCAIEIRQDQIATEAGQARWAMLLADVMGRVALEV